MSAFRQPDYATDAAPRRKLIWTGALLLLGTALVWILCRREAAESVFQPAFTRVEAPSMSPWREPERDLGAFFPGATRYETEIKILSGRRLDLQERLGRPPRPDENSLHLYQVRGEGGPRGTVVTHHVKGENGAIEIVLAVTPENRVCGLRLQRLREPEGSARALQSPEWLDSFLNKSARDALQLGKDIPQLPESARTSGTRVAEAVRSLLILLEVAQGSQPAAHRH